MAKENDVVLIHFEDKPLAFARIESIQPDVKRGWYLVKLLLLQVPLQVVSWLLRDAYIDGEEFTMGGKRMRLGAVVSPEEPRPESGGEEKPGGAAPGAKVIPLPGPVRKQPDGGRR